ncbi:MAG: CHAT domain-containing protein [Spirulinaceae cyanobacterium]
MTLDGTPQLWVDGQVIDPGALFGSNFGASNNFSSILGINGLNLNGLGGLSGATVFAPHTLPHALSVDSIPKGFNGQLLDILGANGTPQLFVNGQIIDPGTLLGRDPGVFNNFDSNLGVNGLNGLNLNELSSFSGATVFTPTALSATASPELFNAQPLDSLGSNSTSQFSAYGQAIEPNALFGSNFGTSNDFSRIVGGNGLPVGALADFMTEPSELDGSDNSAVIGESIAQENRWEISPQRLQLAPAAGQLPVLTTKLQAFVEQVEQAGWQATALAGGDRLQISHPQSLLNLEIDPQRLEDAPADNVTLAQLLTSPAVEPGDRPTPPLTADSTVTSVAPDPHQRLANRLESAEVWQEQQRIERRLSRPYSQQLGAFNPAMQRSAANVREMLTTIESQTGSRSVIVYAISNSEGLDLILISGSGKPIRQRVPAATPEQLARTARQFRRTVMSPQRQTAYQKPAQTLYSWLIEPIRADLERLGATNILFSLGPGLRTLPLAALHDGEEFLVEQYSFSQIPSVNLIDSHYQPIHNSAVLAMGRSQFTDNVPLPAVPYELAAIDRQFDQGKTLLNEQFTVQNLQNQSQQHDIIHLATHSYFEARNPEQSYIQLWDAHLTFQGLRALSQRRSTPIELLIFSSCETGVDHREAELGFGGLAVQTGAKSAIASLWQVSDTGTLTLMSELYAAFANPEITIKAQALRQAQLAMIQGRVSAPAHLDHAEDLAHPFYWSAFQLIGSPW